MPDFRGSGAAQQVMDTFNGTLWDELDGSGILKMVGEERITRSRCRSNPRTSSRPTRGGPEHGAVADGLVRPPVNANDLAFGYTGVTPGRPVGAVRMALQPEPAHPRQRNLDSRHPILRLAR